MPENPPSLSVSDFIAITNQILENAYPTVIVEGEVMSFKTSQNKWVFFDLKDASASVGCFLPLSSLTHPLADGMKIRVRAHPKLTNWGKFSLTVSQIIPVGQGSIKKSLDLLKEKLAKEGLFAPERKRPITTTIQHIGVISSIQAAGYHDFLKIIGERWGGLKISVASTAVQGLDAAGQIIRALDYLNEHGQVEAIAIIRGGGSADDLSAFNDEALARAIAASKTPVITGIGHEVDESLADLVADVRASTPSNAAERLTRDKSTVVAEFRPALAKLATSVNTQITTHQTNLRTALSSAHREITSRINSTIDQIASYHHLLDQLNPNTILARGYALLTGDPTKIGTVVKITTSTHNIKAEVKDVTKR